MESGRPYACPGCGMRSVAVGICPDCRRPLARIAEPAPVPATAVSTEEEELGEALALEARSLCPACGDPLLPEAPACASCGIALG